MIRVAVLSTDGLPLMPSKASRVRRWLKEGRAKIVHNDLGIFQVQMITGVYHDNCQTQPIVVGVDPGKLYTVRFVG